MTISRDKITLFQRVLLVSLAFFGIGAWSAHAQLLPPVRLPEPTPIPEPLEPKSPPLELPPSNQNPGGVEVPPLTLRSLKVIGNTVFSSQELLKLVDQYLNKYLTVADLNDLQDKISDYYVKRGYINSGAAILIVDNPKLNLVAADLIIRISEGRLSEITINGSKRLSKYVKDRLKQPGAFNINRLNKDFLLLQDNELIDQISGSLEAADPVLINLAKLTVDVKPSKPYKASVVTDNYRNPGVGSFERGIDFTALNPLALGDKLSVGYRNTNGSNIFNASYSAQINRQGTSLRFSYLNGTNSTIEKPFDNFGLQNSTQVYSFGIRQPLLIEASIKYRSEFGLSLSLDHLETQDELLGFNFPISRGADDSGQTKITTLRFGQDWQYRDSKQSIFLKSLLSLGIDIGSTTAPNFNRGQFFSWRGDAYWARQLPLRLTFISKAELQLSNRPLVSSEQLSLGGFDSIRGYRQDAVLGDNGFFGSLELRIPILDGTYGRLSISPFFDIGLPWDNAVNSESKLLASTGLSFQYNFSDRVSANFTWSLPLLNVSEDRKSLQEQGFLFSLKWSVF
ncbi:MAG: BamA/TamA family outer membrane protein [Thermosynechococcaceae cyanobacterium MS004]|nr:BamA/TamA family outer membrane protein [Thermosynechococcaceae cyanobacterium MS004]